MISMRLFLWLLAIILIEGYVVLAYELLAIRQAIPFVGSGTDTISIVIASVLMPLAFGYQAGGHFKPRLRAPYLFSVRDKLAQNLRVSSIIILFGISYLPMQLFFRAVLDTGVEYRLLITALYCGIFVIYPVFLLGQTIPLITHFFSKKSLPKVTGKILFVSTTGSFLGAVFTTLVLMALIGVNYTAFFCLALLALILVMVGGRDKQKNLGLALALIVGGFLMNSESVLKLSDVVEYNQYNIIRIVEEEKTGDRHISLNGNASSKITPDQKGHDYVEFINNAYIYPTLDTPEKKPMDILVIGAGGFTLGIKDNKNNYDFIDIDKSLKRVSEEFLHKKELGENKKFIPTPARAFLTQSKKKYDLVLIDAYLGQTTLPEHLATRDFFIQAKSTLREDGVMIMNFITSINFKNTFARNIDQTLRSVFPYLTRQIIDAYEYDPQRSNFTNVLYLFHNHAEGNEKPSIYTDMKNSIFLDMPAKILHAEARKAQGEKEK